MDQHELYRITSGLGGKITGEHGIGIKLKSSFQS
jgi:FAD/FMN-containing dehydrogenase